MLPDRLLLFSAHGINSLNSELNTITVVGRYFQAIHARHTENRTHNNQKPPPISSLLSPLFPFPIPHYPLPIPYSLFPLPLFPSSHYPLPITHYPLPIPLFPLLLVNIENGEEGLLRHLHPADLLHALLALLLLLEELALAADVAAVTFCQHVLAHCRDSLP